jgi:hypothetical protein
MRHQGQHGECNTGDGEQVVDGSAGGNAPIPSLDHGMESPGCSSNQQRQQSDSECL